MKLETRMKIERQIIRRVIKDALADPEIELSEGDHDDPPCRKAKVLLENCTDMDEARLYYHRKGNKAVFGWVFFVLGNSGWDVICDCTANLEDRVAGALALANRLEARHDK